MNAADLKAETVLSVRELKVHFPVRAKAPWTPKRWVKAVDGVSFDLFAGETLGIVGESGCGKSTLARALIDLVPVKAGSVAWLGRPMAQASRDDWLSVRRNVQMVFQDPLASLDPRMNIEQVIAEPLRTHERGLGGDETRRRVAAVMARVGLDPSQRSRYPHEFSGGQCQRIGIARALVTKPKVIICDEPVSALDVSIQAQIINLLQDLQRDTGISLIFIAHDLAVVKHVSHRVLVMYLGRVMELSTRDTLYAEPAHPYTRALLSAIPVPDPVRQRTRIVRLLEGDIPSPIDPPSGCVFRTRCPEVFEACASQVPTLRPCGPRTEAACLRL